MAPQAMIPPNTSGASRGAAPWFSGAPWTKVLVWTWVVVYFLTRHFHKKNPSKEAYDDDYVYHSISLPIVLQFLAFDTTGDLVMGLGYLALQLRRLEREISSVQFAEYVLLQIPVGLIVHQVLLVVFGVPPSSSTGPEETSDIWSYLPPLPTLLMAGSLHWYAYYTPRLYPNFISVFGGMKFSEKALMQLWGIYLLMHSHSTASSSQQDSSSQPESWWLASNFATTTLSYVLSGVLSSTLYMHLFVSNSSAKDPMLVLLPNWLVNKFPVESLSGWFFLDPPPRIFAPALSGRGAPTRQRQRPPAAAPATAPAAPAPVEPSPDAVAQLVAMGFPEEQVTAALRQTNNNVERAADRLLMGS